MDSTHSTSDFIEIPLTQGQVAKIDAKNADLVNLGWFAKKATTGFYAVRNNPPTGSNRKTERLHRVILERMIGRELLPNEDVDHADGDGLNNLEANIRLATRTQNRCNSRKQKNSSAPYKGITAHGARWIARVRLNGERIYLGIFDTPEQAHAAYCAAALKYHGEFANFGGSS